jgi:hypothetical protein
MALEKKSPSAKQKSLLMMHLVAFLVVNAILWFTWYNKPVPADGFKYPGYIWITSAWFLSLIGHWAALYSNYADAGMDKYTADANN